MIAAPSASDCHSPGIPKGGLHGNRPNSGTSVHAIATCIYRGNKRIVTPDGPGAFNVNPCLIAGDDPLLFHAGHRRVLPRMSEAVAKALRSKGRGQNALLDALKAMRRGG